MTEDGWPLKAAVLTSAAVALLLLLLALTAQRGHTTTGPVRSAPQVRFVPAVADPSVGTELAARHASSGGRSNRLDADPAWVTATARASGIDPIALHAYGRAVLLLSRAKPDCRLGWTTLAAIGAIESDHGGIGDRRLRPDGTSSAPIIGPALDGDEFAAIPATSSSARLHGDRQWDHAVGPMQFIPTTWARWASDGNFDGSADPGNLFDASYAAARYLCAAGSDLTSGQGWTAAVHSYNHSSQYVADVLAWADAYASRTSK